ncbi:helix-turn-helix domain-containing protein [Nocardioides dubius]
MEVAERLFASKGVNATLVSDIVEGAGQRNPSALRYHFGSKEGVLKAIVERHQQRVEERRSAIIAGWPAPGPTTSQDAMQVLVQPLVDLLADESGRRYLCIVGQIIDQLDLDGTTNIGGERPGLVATIEAMRAQVPDRRAAVVSSRVQAVILMVAASLAARARDLLSGGTPAVATPLFNANLVAMGAAALAAELPEGETP